jgi:hypothetical protein
MTTQALFLAICVNIVFIVIPGYFFWKILKTPPSVNDSEDD